jgi:hypothetical protein
MTGDSAANTAKTHTITAPAVNSGTSKKKKVVIHSITVSTKGADIAADVGVLLTKANGETWNVELRSGKVFGGHFNFDHPIDCGHGDVTITTDAGGASVVVTTSVVYEVF